MKSAREPGACRAVRHTEDKGETVAPFAPTGKGKVLALHGEGRAACLPPQQHSARLGSAWHGSAWHGKESEQSTSTY